jgi:hypothetical protein
MKVVPVPPAAAPATGYGRAGDQDSARAVIASMQVEAFNRSWNCAAFGTAARAFSTEVGLTFGHGPLNLVVQQPGRVVLDAQFAAVRWRGDAGFGLPDPMEGLTPSRSSTHLSGHSTHLRPWRRDLPTHSPRFIGAI